MRTSALAIALAALLALLCTAAAVVDCPSHLACPACNSAVKQLCSMGDVTPAAGLSQALGVCSEYGSCLVSGRRRIGWRVGAAAALRGALPAHCSAASSCRAPRGGRRR
jgi:hypothetical protein